MSTPPAPLTPPTPLVPPTLPTTAQGATFNGTVGADYKTKFINYLDCTQNPQLCADAQAKLGQVLQSQRIFKSDEEQMDAMRQLANYAAQKQITKLDTLGGFRDTDTGPAKTTVAADGSTVYSNADLESVLSGQNPNGGLNTNVQGYYVPNAVAAGPQQQQQAQAQAAQIQQNIVTGQGGSNFDSFDVMAGNSSVSASFGKDKMSVNQMTLQPY